MGEGGYTEDDRRVAGDLKNENGFEIGNMFPL